MNVVPFHCTQIQDTDSFIVASDSDPNAHKTNGIQGIKLYSYREAANN